MGHRAGKGVNVQNIFILVCMVCRIFQSGDLNVATPFIPIITRRKEEPDNQGFHLLYRHKIRKSDLVKAMDNIDQASQTPTLRISKDFPEGYGDILLQSSDADIFHFSSFLLAYSSPVLKDMFELAAKATEDVCGQKQTPQPKQRDPVLLWEDAITICGSYFTSTP
jgi:hypothetical protein